MNMTTYVVLWRLLQFRNIQVSWLLNTASRTRTRRAERLRDCCMSRSDAKSFVLMQSVKWPRVPGLGGFPELSVLLVHHYCE